MASLHGPQRHDPRESASDQAASRARVAALRRAQQRQLDGVHE